jgi:hypothetical protein
MRWHVAVDVRIGAQRAAELRLGSAACGGEGSVDHHGDQEIFENIAGRMLADLRDFLQVEIAKSAAPYRSAAQSCTEGGELFVISTQPPAWAIGVSLSPEGTIALRRRATGRGVSSILSSRQVAVEAEIVALGCHLGDATLSTAEIAALEPGDLIVLTRKITEDLPIAVNGEVPVSGTARLQKFAGAAQVLVTQRVDLRKAGQVRE